jgi:serine/threonine protein kinase
MDLTADFETDTTSGNLPSEIKSTILAHQDDLIGFLGLIQYFRVPLIPITWQPALGPLGRGATAYVNQAAVNVEMSHAFKRMRSHTCFDTWVNEVMILGRLGNHPNIASIEACCLEILDNGKLSPVLVFKKADFGDLEAFMRSKAGLTMNDEDVVRLCAGIGSGLQHIHLSSAFQDLKA